MAGVSAGASKLYNYISERIGAGLSPSIREMCADLGIKSTSTAYRYIEELIAADLLEKTPGMRRTLRLTGQAPSVSVPILGVAAAGNPILAVEDIEGYIPVALPSGSSDLFAIRIKGESMINVGILDGDYVVIRRTAYADNGEIVLALIGEEATLKRFYKEKGRFRLQPENDTMEPIIAQEVAILGKAVTVVRNLEQ